MANNFKYSNPWFIKLCIYALKSLPQIVFMILNLYIILYQRGMEIWIIFFLNIVALCLSYIPMNIFSYIMYKKISRNISKSSIYDLPILLSYSRLNDDNIAGAAISTIIHLIPDIKEDNIKRLTTKHKIYFYRLIFTNDYKLASFVINIMLQLHDKNILPILKKANNTRLLKKIYPKDHESVENLKIRIQNAMDTLSEAN